jgi:hypothetical protein
MASRKHCPKCGAETRNLAAIYCGKCGAQFPSAAPDSSVASYLLCPACNAQNAFGSKECTKCGAALPIVSSTKPNATVTQIVSESEEQTNKEATVTDQTETTEEGTPRPVAAAVPPTKPAPVAPPPVDKTVVETVKTETVETEKSATKQPTKQSSDKQKSTNNGLPTWAWILIIIGLLILLGIFAFQSCSPAGIGNVFTSRTPAPTLAPKGSGSDIGNTGVTTDTNTGNKAPRQNDTIAGLSNPSWLGTDDSGMLPPGMSAIGDVKVNGVIYYDSGSGEATIVVNTSKKEVKIYAEWGASLVTSIDEAALMSEVWNSGCDQNNGGCTRIRVVQVTDKGTTQYFVNRPPSE